MRCKFCRETADGYYSPGKSNVIFLMCVGCAFRMAARGYIGVDEVKPLILVEGTTKVVRGKRIEKGTMIFDDPADY